MLRSLHFQVESLHKDGGAEAGEVEKELKDIEQKMSDLVKDREDISKRIMDRRVLQVTTLQELGKLEAIWIFARYQIDLILIWSSAAACLKISFQKL